MANWLARCLYRNVIYTNRYVKKPTLYHFVPKAARLSNRSSKGKQWHSCNCKLWSAACTMYICMCKTLAKERFCLLAVKNVEIPCNIFCKTVYVLTEVSPMVGRNKNLQFWLHSLFNIFQLCPRPIRGRYSMTTERDRRTKIAQLNANVCAWFHTHLRSGFHASVVPFQKYRVVSPRLQWLKRQSQEIGC